METIIDVRSMLPKERHPTIFKTWDGLPSGGSILLVNDHDPIPLYYQFAGEFAGAFQWEYLEEGPDVWRVQIRKGKYASPGFVPHPRAKETGNSPKPVRFDEPFVLDVRPLFERGESPCGPIDEAAARVSDGQSFVLLAPFEPKPLFAKLGREGFSHKSERQADGSWRVVFCRDGKAEANTPLVTTTAPVVGASDTVVVDTRGLEPPEPLVRTLNELEKLPKSGRLLMRSDRRPMHLFTELEARGFLYDCTEQEDHSFITEIWHE